MLTPFVDGARGEGWRSDRGELRVRRPAPLVLVFVEQGYLNAHFVAPIVVALDAVVRQGRPTLFVDAERLEGYDPVIRTRSTDWLREHRASVVRQHMLVRSRLAQMGLSIASLALGGVLVGHHDRRSFDAALAEALAGATGTDRRAP